MEQTLVMRKPEIEEGPTVGVLCLRSKLSASRDVVAPPASSPKAAEMKDAQTATPSSSESALTHYLSQSLIMRHRCG
jgi:hypothetical protein